MSLTIEDLQSIRDIVREVVREEIQGVENDVKEIYDMLKSRDQRFNRLKRRVTKLEQANSTP